MKKQINTKMELLTELQYRYDQLKCLNISKIECSDGKIIDFNLTKSLQLMEELMKVLAEEDKPKVLEVDLSRLPADFDLDKFIEEFKQASKEWSQISLNSFINAKFQTVDHAS